MHVVGHCALQSASTAPLVILEKPWKTVSKVSSTAFLPVLLTPLDAVMVFTTASWSPVKFGVTISSWQVMPIWPNTQSSLETKSSKPWDLRLVTSHWNQWVLSNLELVSLSDLSTFYCLTLFIFNKEFISLICWSFKFPLNFIYPNFYLLMLLSKHTQILWKSLRFYHFGWGGKGIGGNLIYGIGFISKGFGGGSWDGLIPPLANGKSPIDGICCFSVSIGIVLGWLYTIEGILFVFFGLFSASSLYAKPPCF